MIVHHNVVDFQRIEAECRLLSAIHDGSKDDTYSQVADLAHFLSSLAPEDRRERLAILQQLDEKSADGQAITITLNLSSGTTDVKQADSTFRARSHPDYLKAVRSATQSAPTRAAHGFDQDKRRASTR